MSTPGNSCSRCSLDYVFTPANLLIYWYSAQPWFSFGQTMCPQCGYPARCFMRFGVDELLSFFIRGDFGFIVEEFAPDEIKLAFETVNELKELSQHALTPRMTEEVDKLGVLLAHIPTDLLWAELTSPEEPHKLPDQWV